MGHLRALAATWSLEARQFGYRGLFVPSIVRFLVFLLVLGGLGFAAIYALATFVEPEPREISISVPSSRLSVN